MYVITWALPCHSCPCSLYSSRNVLIFLRRLANNMPYKLVLISLPLVTSQHHVQFVCIAGFPPSPRCVCRYHYLIWVSVIAISAHGRERRQFSRSFEAGIKSWRASSEQEKGSADLINYVSKDCRSMQQNRQIYFIDKTTCFQD